MDVLPHRRSTDVLHEEFGLRSLHRTCQNQGCGICLILLDEQPVLSCLLPAFELRDRDIWTAEGLALLKEFGDIVEGFGSVGVRPCPICGPARTLATEALLRRTLRPTRQQAKDTAASIRCDCCSEARVISAVLKTARIREARLHAQ